MLVSREIFANRSKSLPSRGAWIEIDALTNSSRRAAPSLPSRGAWIEIRQKRGPYRHDQVAPLAGSVDRNVPIWPKLSMLPSVAPLAGSVDRNGFDVNQEVSYLVAPLAGSVDRNRNYQALDTSMEASLPSRGAWIEIAKTTAAGTSWACRSPRGERG